MDPELRTVAPYGDGVGAVGLDLHRVSAGSGRGVDDLEGPLEAPEVVRGHLRHNYRTAKRRGVKLSDFHRLLLSKFTRHGGIHHQALPGMPV